MHVGVKILVFYIINKLNKNHSMYIKIFKKGKDFLFFFYAF